MALRSQFAQIVTLLRHELGRSVNVAVGTEELDRLKFAVNKAYAFLGEEYHWPHLRYEADVPLLQAQRFYDFPAEMDSQRIESATLWLASGRSQALERGIALADYDLYNSREAAEASYARKWDVRWVETQEHEQIEVWPIPPEDDEQVLVLRGQRKLAKLVNDGDVVHLDDYLLAAHAAADIESDEKLRQKHQGNFSQRLARLRANSEATLPDRRLGLPSGGLERPFDVTLVVR